jgi:isopentenyl-diphosphate Delta-isomerase
VTIVGAKEGDPVELVSPDGEAVGVATVAQAHQPPGRLHRAFSVLLVDPSGRLLLQQRAGTKTRFPWRWANACCGHPAPGSEVASEAARRLEQEVGVREVALTDVGVYVYRADDPATGRVEYEYDHVLIGRVGAAPALRPDPAEVASVQWVEVAQLRLDLAETPQAYAPWLAGVLDLLPPDG